MEKRIRHSKILRKVINMSSIPMRMWIDGTSYQIKRKKRIQDPSTEELAIQHQEFFNISPDDNSNFSTSFHAPSYFYEKIHRHPQFISFQQNTKTTVMVPTGLENRNISITGDDAVIVARAREELHTILEDIRSRSKPSHFISIPTLSDEIKNNFIKFKEAILGFDEKIQGVEESVFINPEKLHITILVLSLFDDTETAEATKVLNNLKEDILYKLMDGKKFRIRVKGLDCMDKNYKKSTVLYAKAAFENDDGLQNLVDNIFHYFHEKGFVKEIRGDHITMHITLMNTKYRTPKKKLKIPFNATEIISKYKDLDLGVCDFDTIHLSIMASVDDIINCAELEDDVEIKVTKSGKYMTQFHVASVFYSAIIGLKGLKKKELEMSTDTHIKVPKIGEAGDIIITGTSERNIASARTRIHMIVLQMRDKQQFTHFVSIPVTSDQISRNFETFKSNLLNGPPLRGVDETIFQTPNKFHLTIAPLVLLDDVEKELAAQALIECREEILDPLFKNSGPLKIIMEGLEIMNDDPTDVDVLYGKVMLNAPKYNTSFQKLSDQIVEYFSRKGLIRKQYENVKLHVTLMNSLFRKGAEAAQTHNKRNTRESFDATYILNKYKTFNFGEADLKDVQLSIRFTTSEGKYYDALAAIKF